ncbi:toxin C-terminal domain-containing protein [Pseudomonas gingeri]|uniref:toxin C-terminal domain-containing protein n=2 Tax=Pseudomonas gingeri TaxID=117681 RepID=UPI0015A218EC|nr:toxin C-terminal domain-containing protein [Pseudomonas gingeri]NWD06843.1 hypothetical protein [Pseudomonas gingeri]NWE26473.1 hypothetical protein [Pseudomonas gingeri]NWE31441.1 hypothetical protein [Pseudomonas gingeri]NWE57541.1 hypothetical protein [Pseudomonas gingeri]NWE97398.1 hypothetical protein [Pseudomonas gingeri]
MLKSSRVAACMPGIPDAGVLVCGVPMKLAEPVYKTNSEAAQAAKAPSFRKVNETVHGHTVFKKGNFYITRDVDGHIGGAWKMAKSIEDLASKTGRAGTFDANLRKVGD